MYHNIVYLNINHTRTYFVIDIIIVVKVSWPPWDEVNMDMFNCLSSILPILQRKGQRRAIVHSLEDGGDTMSALEQVSYLVCCEVCKPCHWTLC